MGVGHDIEADNAAWSFGNDVPETFVDHIKASVYETTAAFHWKPPVSS